MIFTIGYQRLDNNRLMQVVGALNALLIDVRSNPQSRKPGFSQKALRETFGAAYLWLGDCLGGKTPVTEHGLSQLDVYENHPTHHCLLLCMEEAPGECHPHHAICGPHFPDAIHLFRDHGMTARELSQAFADDVEDYPIADLEEFGALVELFPA